MRVPAAQCPARTGVFSRTAWGPLPLDRAPQRLAGWLSRHREGPEQDRFAAVVRKIFSL